MRRGLFTPTEGAIGVVAYALFLDVIVCRTLGFRAICKVSFETVDVTATILLIVTASEIFGWLMTTTRVSEQAVGWVLSITEQKWLILLIAILIMVPNLCIGLLTPPMGIVLFILARVGGISFEDAARDVTPFMVPLVGVLLLCTYVPEVVMHLPNRWYR